MKNRNGSREPALVDEITGLREKVMELTARLHALEGDLDAPNGDGKPTSRRDLLRLAGALAAGAAGGIVLRPITAAAITGGNMILGNANDAGAPTKLSPTAASAPTALFEVVGQSPPTIPANPITDLGSVAVTVPVFLAVGPHGVFPVFVTDPGPPVVTAPGYPGVAPIQGIGGPVVEGTTPNDIHLSEGVDGWAAVDPADLKSVGAGVVGTSDYGIGVVGSGGTDMAAFGTGYFAQAAITDANGILMSGPPPTPVYNFEQARDKDGVLWLSNSDGTWRRSNSLIPMAPFRKYDSRPSARPANSVTTLTIAGQNGIPSDAVGVFGNLTALGPAADGFMTMYPTGTPVPGVNSVNYSRGVSAWSNHIMVKMGTGGQVSIYVSGNGATNILFDITGYIV